MANPTRFPFGIALGHYNQFNAYGRGGPNTPSPVSTQYEQVTAGLLAQASTAPDVSMGSLFYTNNTASTTIVNFVHQQIGRAGALTAAGQVDTTSPPPEGKLITVIFLDNSTQLTNSGNLVLSSTNNLIGSGNIITLLGSNGKWWEMERSYNNTSEVTVFATNANSSLNMNGVRVGILNNTGSTTNSVIALSGGQVGQEVSFMLQGSNAVRFITGGNLFMTVTNAVLVNASGAYKFIKYDSATWRMLAVNSGGAF